MSWGLTRPRGRSSRLVPALMLVRRPCEPLLWLTFVPLLFSSVSLQLYVPSNVWKASRIPVADLAAARDGSVDKERVGCLISEVRPSLLTFLVF